MNNHNSFCFFRYFLFLLISIFSVSIIYDILLSMENDSEQFAEDENKEMTPYAYDVLYLEYLDEETFEKPPNIMRYSFSTAYGVC
mgnify:CR=1 FL=1